MTESAKDSGHYLHITEPPSHNGKCERFWTLSARSASMHEYRRQTGRNVRIQPEIQPRRPENCRFQSPSAAAELFRIAESGGLLTDTKLCGHLQFGPRPVRLKSQDFGIWMKYGIKQIIVPPCGCSERMGGLQPYNPANQIKNMRICFKDQPTGLCLNIR